MMKRAISLILCLLVLTGVFAGCSSSGADGSEGDGQSNVNNGAFITMYLTDEVYDLDPAYAYGNESALKLVSLVFDNLFVLDENGKVQKSLAKEYEIKEDDNAKEYSMIITLNDTKWTDGSAITANDVYYAWRRILAPWNDFQAASLLFDIKNARDAKGGQTEVSIDDVGISALNEKQLQIQFEGRINYDQFLLNLTSYALVPLREDIVEKTEDWAKKPSTICSSGPFRLREVSYEADDKHLVLERNAYYYRDIQKDKLDKVVNPYRLIIDYTMTDEDIKKAYDEGSIFYVGDIPLSLRAGYQEQAEVSDALSTHSYILNENAVVRYYNSSAFNKLAADETERITALLAPISEKDEISAAEKYPAPQNGVDGEMIFANQKVRKAMSLALDRQAIADAVVFAKAATALVPYGVYDSTSKKDLFREVGSDILATSADMAAAKSLIAESGVDPSKFMFTIAVAGYDDVHVAIAQMVAAAWTELGFHVQVNAIETIENDDIMKTLQSVPKDIRDDIFAEGYRAGLFDVYAIDYVAFSADAYSVLAPFAKGFTGGASTSENSTTYEIPAHSCGYDSEAYNAKIEAAFAEKDIKARAALLHEAEAILMEDLPIIPVIFNQNATLTNKDLSKIKYTYYGTAIFTEVKQKNFELYVPVDEKK